MPHLVLFVIAGAGLYAGYRILISKIDRSDASQQTAHVKKQSTPTPGPRDLGALVWDEKDRVYRPKS